MLAPAMTANSSPKKPLLPSKNPLTKKHQSTPQNQAIPWIPTPLIE